MTSLALIKRALRLIGVLGTGESPSPAEQQDALEILQALVDEWGTEKLTIYRVAREVFPLVASQQDYTIGPTGADFTYARPLWLDRASILSANNPLQPVELGLDGPLDVQQWQAIPVKNVVSALPTRFYYDFTFPNGTLSFWPIPNVSTLQVVLYLPTAVTGFSALTTDYTFPPGYQNAFVYNLAKRCAPEFGRALPPDVDALAVSTLANVKRANIRLTDLTTDPALLPRRSGHYNWLSDQQ